VNAGTVERVTEDVIKAEVEAFYTERLGERCGWSDLPQKTCAHCTHGYRAAYMEYPSVEELWS